MTPTQDPVREALDALLREAVAPLQQAFGIHPVRVSVVSGAAEEVVRVVVQLPAGWEGDPEQALRAFDAAWWLQNCHRAPCLVVFDYTQEHAVEQQTPHARHTWEPQRLAAQILRSWVRETHAHLPAWTPPDVANAYVGLLSAVHHLVEVTQRAEREETRKCKV